MNSYDFFCAEYESGLRTAVSEKSKYHNDHKCSKCTKLYPCDYDIWCSDKLCSIGKKCGFAMKEKLDVRKE